MNINEIPKNINGMQLKKLLNDNKDLKIELTQMLVSMPEYGNIKNLIWCLQNNFDIKKYVCKNCGKQLTLKHVNDLRQFCSIKCAMNSDEVQTNRSKTIESNTEYWKNRQKKIEQTNLERYGVKHPAQNEEVKNKIKNTIAKDKDHWKNRNEKIKQTCLTKYGVENVYQAEFVKEKKKKSYLEHYGVEHPMLTEEVQNKIKKTNLERYGYENPWQDKSNIFKQYWNIILAWHDYVIPLFSEEDFKGKSFEYKWKCQKCGKEFAQKIYNTKFMKSVSSYMPRCPNCYPIRKSGKEQLIANFVQSLGFFVIRNDRQLIKPYELDIVIPEKKIAIEFNGVFYHSEELLHNPYYHLMKTELCEKEGYQLIHIFEHEWDFSQELIKEKIKAILGINQEKVYARKCTVKKISVKEKNEFLNKYHIQGEDKSKIKLGLFYNDKLVAVMTFGKPRFNQQFNWELIRYATAKHIIGGAGKLLAYFRKQFTGSIITYADRRFSQGNMYKKLGFKLERISEPNYWWVKNNEILSRYQTQKYNLKDILTDKFDHAKSENENMIANGYYQIFDCGNLVYSLK